MTQWRLQTNSIHNTFNGGFNYAPIHPADNFLSETESDVSCRLYTAFTVTDIRGRMALLPSGGADIAFRAGGSTTSVSVAFTVTGWAEDLTDSATITANDLCSIFDSDTLGMHSDTAQFESHAITIEHASIDEPPNGSGFGQTVISAPSTYWPINNFHTRSATPANVGFRPQRIFTFSNLFVNVVTLTGAWDFAPSIKTTQSSSVIAALTGTGITEDLTGTQAIGTSDDDVNMSVIEVTAGTVQVSVYSLDTDTPERVISASGHSSNQESRRYSFFDADGSAGGVLLDMHNRTGSTTAGFLQTFILTAPGTGNVTFQVDNTQSTNLTLAISSTGYAEDLTGTETVTDAESITITADGISGGIRPTHLTIELPTSTLADTLVEANVDADLDIKVGLWGPYWIDTDTAVIVFIDDGEDLSFARTTNKGATWATTEIKVGTAEIVACWFDKETPGDNGTLVHITWLDRTPDDCLYRTLDVSDGSLGTERIIDSTVTIDTTSNLNRLAITKTVNGNLIVAFLTPTEIECYRSTDSGANWTDRTDVFETTTSTDWVLLFPANVDDGDACALYWDRGDAETSIKMYDDSANTWTETVIVASSGMLSDSIHINIDGAIRLSDSHLLMAAHTNDDNTFDDLVTSDITVDSIASPTVTAKTEIFTDVDQQAQVAVFINQQNDDVYVSWFSGGTWETTVDVVYKKSTDDMSTWDAEMPYQQAPNDDFSIMQAGRTVGNSGGRYQPTFYNAATTDIWVNETNDIEIAAVAVGTRRIFIT